MDVGGLKSTATTLRNIAGKADLAVIVDTVKKLVLPEQDSLALTLAVAGTIIGVDKYAARVFDGMAGHVTKAFGKDWGSADVTSRSLARLAVATTATIVIEHFIKNADEDTKKLVRYAEAFAVTPYVWKAVASAVAKNDLIG
jgi:hypothetical protein